MNKTMLSMMMVLMLASLVSCEGKTTVVREVVSSPAKDPGVKIRLNDGKGVGVEVNIPTKK